MVFPAPFFPSKATISPASILKLILLKTGFLLNDLDTLFTSIAYVINSSSFNYLKFIGEKNYPVVSFIMIKDDICHKKTARSKT
ncbi:Uncharacterised protein [Chlamydia trachomatis]|nr:Uncharacterised protein [Chlamydia trachomatis]